MAFVYDYLGERFLYEFKVVSEDNDSGTRLDFEVCSPGSTVSYGTFTLIHTHKGDYDFAAEHLCNLQADIFECSEDLEIFLVKYQLRRFLWIDSFQKQADAPKGLMSDALKKAVAQELEKGEYLLCYPCSYGGWSNNSISALQALYKNILGMQCVENFCLRRPD